MESLDTLPKSIRAKVREVVFQVCLTTVDACQALGHTLTLVLRDAQGCQILEEMESNGRLSSWLQNIVNLTVNYRVKAYAAVDDFRFLMKSSENTTNTFKELEDYANKIIKVEPKLEMECQSGVCESLEKLKSFLSKPLDLDQIDSSPSLRVLSTRLEQEYLSEQSVAEKYNVPLMYDSPKIEVCHAGQLIEILPQIGKMALQSVTDPLPVPENITESQFHSFGGDKPGPIFTKKDTSTGDMSNLKKISLKNGSPIKEDDEDENPFSPKGAGLMSSPRDNPGTRKKSGDDSFYGIESDEGHKEAGRNETPAKDDDSYSVGSYGGSPAGQRKNSDISFGSDTGRKVAKDADKDLSYGSEYSLDEDEEQKKDKKLIEPIEVSTKPKYKQVEDPALKKNLEPTKLQKAITLGRNITPLEDQGRAYKPVPFKLPNEDIARKYLSDFVTTTFEIKDRMPS